MFKVINGKLQLDERSQRILAEQAIPPQITIERLPVIIDPNLPQEVQDDVRQTFNVPD